MSWTDEEIDKLYQEKTKGLHFEYKPEYWNEMEALLPEKRKGDGLWFMTSLLFLGLVSAVAVFNVSEGQVQKVVYAENSLGSNVVDSEVVEHTVEYKNVNTSDFSSADNIKKDEKNTETPIKNNKVNNGSITTINEGVTIKTNPKGFNNEVVNTSKLNVKSVEKSVHEENVETTLSFKDREQQVSLINISAAEDLSLSSPKHEVDKLEFKQLDQKEQNSELAGFTNNFKMPIQTSFYVQGLGGVSQSLVSPSNKTAYSYGIGIGAQFRKGKFVFSSGVNGIISNHQDLELNRQAKVYSYGSQIIESHLNYSQIYMVEANLDAGVQLGRHMLSVGVRPSYSISSKVSYNSSANEEGSRVVYGHMDGLQRFGLKPTIGYSFMLPKNFTIGLNVGAQLRSMVNEEFINGVNNKLPIDGQLYLRKKISFRR